jgi:DNA-binding protein Fis
MGCKGMDGANKAGAFSHRVVQVTIGDKGSATVKGDMPVSLTVANDWETLRFVKENMDDVVANVVRVKHMDAQSRKQVEESAELFEQKLEPLFTLIAATSQEHVMDKLSVSLKKALLLMAMDRYSCDSDRICRALGISKGKLEKELKRCGLSHQPSKAA